MVKNTKLSSLLKQSEYKNWQALQNMAISSAQKSLPLTKELVNEFLLLASQTSNKRHLPHGYRTHTKKHEIWPGGKNSATIGYLH